MGVLVIIEGGFGVGKMILLCVDIDVLELLDVIGIVYVFKNLGFNYVCGYDGYVAVLLGAVKVFKKYQDIFLGMIKLVFQLVEEIGVGV